MSNRFTERAQRVILIAQEEAKRLNHDYVGTEHILLGLFAEPEGLAARALAEAGLHRATVEARVLEFLPRQTQALLDNPPYIPQASLALQGALGEALRLGHNYIGTEHILLALFRDRDTLAARILADLGAGREATATRLGEMIAASR
jgi:ATP-dependent Clp protease ATP-binding subunit ClpC